MKERLLAHLIVKSINNKNVPVDIPQWSLDMQVKPMDLRLMLNYLKIQGELKHWEENGQEYVNLFS